jgi:hypothetical protein
MARDRENRTYRVRQLPVHLDTHKASQLLAGLGEDFGPLGNVHVFSLAASLCPSEYPATRTATVMFTKCPAKLDNDQDEWIIPTQHLGLQKDIIFDVHFLGFTALNDVHPTLHSLE